MAETRAQFGLNTLRSVELRGVSGTETLTDAQVQQILADLSLPGVHGIQVSAIDRLFRPRDYESLKILDYFVRARKYIWSTREGFVDPASDEGWNQCISAAGRAGAELRELKRRTAGGRKKARDKKLKTNGSAAYGTIYIAKHTKGGGQRLEPDPQESSVRPLEETSSGGRFRVARYQSDAYLCNCEA